MGGGRPKTWPSQHCQLVSVTVYTGIQSFATFGLSPLTLLILPANYNYLIGTFVLLNKKQQAKLWKCSSIDIVARLCDELLN